MIEARRDGLPRAVQIAVNFSVGKCRLLTELGLSTFPTTLFFLASFFSVMFGTLPYSYIDCLPNVSFLLFG